MKAVNTCSILSFGGEKKEKQKKIYYQSHMEYSVLGE